MSDLILTDGNTSVSWFDEFFKIGYDNVVLSCKFRAESVLALYYFAKFSHQLGSTVTFYPYYNGDHGLDEMKSVVEDFKSRFPNSRLEQFAPEEHEVLKNRVGSQCVVNTWSRLNSEDTSITITDAEGLRRPWTDLSDDNIRSFFEQEGLMSYYNTYS